MIPLMVSSSVMTVWWRLNISRLSSSLMSFDSSSISLGFGNRSGMLGSRPWIGDVDGGRLTLLLLLLFVGWSDSIGIWCVMLVSSWLLYLVFFLGDASLSEHSPGISLSVGANDCLSSSSSIGCVSVISIGWSGVPSSIGSSSGLAYVSMRYSRSSYVIGNNTICRCCSFLVIWSLDAERFGWNDGVDRL